MPGSYIENAARRGKTKRQARQVQKSFPTQPPVISSQAMAPLFAVQRAMSPALPFGRGAFCLPAFACQRRRRCRPRQFPQQASPVMKHGKQRNNAAAGSRTAVWRLRSRNASPGARRLVAAFAISRRMKEPPGRGRRVYTAQRTRQLWRYREYYECQKRAPNVVHEGRTQNQKRRGETAFQERSRFT